MYSVNASETKIMEELVKELSEFNSYMRNGTGPFGRGNVKSRYFFAFNPVRGIDRDFYKRNMELMKTITNILDENCINIKSLGYTFLKDALCIIMDLESLDICFTKEVYPYIADKYNCKSISKVEHCIRNSIDAAYKTVKQKYPDRNCIMNSFDEKPTNKKFLLRAVQEMGDRLMEELSE